MENKSVAGSDMESSWSQTWPPSSESLRETLNILGAAQETRHEWDEGFQDEPQPPSMVSVKSPRQSPTYASGQRPITPETTDDETEPDWHAIRNQQINPEFKDDDDKNKACCKCYKSVWIPFALVAAIIVTVFIADTKRRSASSLPVTHPQLSFQATTFDILRGASRPPYPTTATYGLKVALSRSGDRLVVITDRTDGLIEVWQHLKVERQWLMKRSWSPKGAQEILDLACDDWCTRIVVGIQTLQGASFAAVYQDVVGDGVAWESVGELIDGAYMGQTDEAAIASVDMSADGKIIVVATPYVSSHLYEHTGRVQIYENQRNYPLANSSSKNEGLFVQQPAKVWRPLGAPILGRAYGERVGERLALQRSDGGSIVISHHLWSDSAPGILKVYDFVNGTWTSHNQPLYVPNPRQDSQVISLTRDGTHLAVAQSSSGPEFEGLVEVYRRTDKQFEKIWQCKGERPYDQFGASVAIRDANYTLVVGTAQIRGASQGTIRVFGESNGTWVLEGSPISVAPTRGVWSMTLTEDRLVASSGKYPPKTRRIGNNQGWVGVFESKSNN